MRTRWDPELTLTRQLLFSRHVCSLRVACHRSGSTGDCRVAGLSTNSMMFGLKICACRTFSNCMLRAWKRTNMCSRISMCTDKTFRFVHCPWHARARVVSSASEQCFRLVAHRVRVRIGSMLSLVLFSSGLEDPKASGFLNLTPSWPSS